MSNINKPVEEINNNAIYLILVKENLYDSFLNKCVNNNVKFITELAKVGIVSVTYLDMNKIKDWDEVEAIESNQQTHIQ